MSENTPIESDDAVEAVLRKAAPRPVPPESDVQSVRSAVRSEWRRAANRRRRQKTFTRIAIAASIIVVAFLSLNLLRTSGLEPVNVASIARQSGSVGIVGAQSEVLRDPGLTEIYAGQTIRTGADSGVALAWSTGGSLRIDANTRIDFLSDREVYLASGRIYFDSNPALGGFAEPGASLTIRTALGEVMHVGTQFMVQIDRHELAVSVRQGRVAIAPGGGAAVHAAERQQVTVRGNGSHHTVNIRPCGDAWDWIERSSPGLNLNGRTIDEFLSWVSHETGMALEYESSAAADYAKAEFLNGELEVGPSDALAAWLLTTDLEWRIQEGVIYVSKTP